MREAIEFGRQNKDRYLAELLDFISIPSVSTQPSHDVDVMKAANWLAKNMQDAGLENVSIIETARHPLVYADWLGCGQNAPTILIYGHYDVQPAEPFELWESPPFSPEIRKGFIYGRGASDDKGQVFIHIKAVESYLSTFGKLPVNIKFIIEGEEESGGASLKAYIPEHKDELAADVALISDTTFVFEDQPVIVYGLRGMLYTFLDITGPRRDLHSGSYGGGINNPLNVLGHIIAKLKDEEGYILIPGFYDKVRSITADDQENFSRFPLNEEKWLQETGAPEIWGEPEYTVVERLGARPTLDVNGIIGGYTGPGSKTVLPSKVHAKISMRLVPDQDPDEIFQLYCDYIQKITPPSVSIAVNKFGGSPASITDFRISAMEAATTAIQDVFGKPPVLIREGGSIPVVGNFQRMLGLETILMGFGLPNDRIHAPNERFCIANFYRGIETSIRFLEYYSRLDGKTQES